MVLVAFSRLGVWWYLGFVTFEFKDLGFVNQFLMCDVILFDQ